MGFLPYLTETATSSLMMSQFLGLNKQLSTNDGEMADMTNLTGQHYPLLAPRAQRTKVAHYEQPQGILGKEALALIDGDSLYYDGQKVEGITLSVGGKPKQMVSMGAYLCIWPDKVYYNTKNPEDKGRMDALTEITSGTVTVSLCRNDGTDYDTTDMLAQPEEPADPHNGQLWIDTSARPHTLMQYAASSGEWVQVATVFLKIEAPGLGKAFGEYDTVNISGLTRTNELPEDIDPEEVDSQLADLNVASIIYKTGDNYIVVAGILDATVEMECTDENKLVLKRDVPDCDFICECNNRLWGCYFGLAEDGTTVLNEIYATKLGDFKNWHSFMGLSVDSYTVSVGSDGPFTGAVTLGGYPTFFKEGCVHRISGTAPSSFGMNTMTLRGVQKGSERSMCVVGSTLYYKGTTDVMRYDGSLPVGISTSLGSGVYHNARGGAFGSRYWLSMEDEAGKWHLFCYDTNKGIWHREDDLKALCISAVGDSLYAINEDTGDLIDLLGQAAGEKEGPVKWSATFGVTGYQDENQKYLSRYNIRMKINAGDIVRMFIQYDSDGVWHKEGQMMGKQTRTFMIPVIPRRCDHCQLKLEGTGDVRIFSVGRQYEQGGDGGWR